MAESTPESEAQADLLMTTVQPLLIEAGFLLRTGSDSTLITKEGVGAVVLLCAQLVAALEAEDGVERRPARAQMSRLLRDTVQAVGTIWQVWP